jgi:aminopeptidase N
MLRQMMWSAESGDSRFKKMMRDFIAAHLHKSASTESFYEIVERHMTPEMDLERKKNMAWFFRQWIYGTEIPRYTLEYSTSPAAEGKVLLTGKLSQSEVSDGFIMRVPLYVDLDGGRPVRIGSAAVRGNTSIDFKLTLPKKPKSVMVNAFYDVLARK